MMKKKFFLSTVVSLMTISIFSGCGIAPKVVDTQVPKDNVVIDSDKILQEAKKAFNSGNGKESLKLFEEAIKLGNRDAMYGLGLIYIHEGMNEKGIKLLKQSSDLGNQEAIKILEKLGVNHAQ